MPGTSVRYDAVSGKDYEEVAVASSEGSAGATEAAIACAARSAWRTISGTAVISHSVPWQSGPIA